MCSIHGWYRFPGATMHPQRLATLLASLVRQGAQRGRDGWGVCWSDGSRRRHLQDPSTVRDLDLVGPPGARWCLVSDRATPTTEWAGQDRVEDLQPFHAGRDVWCVHNGTVANDAMLAQELLAQEYPVPVDTTVDSRVLPALLLDATLRAGWNLTGVERVLGDVVGSYALAAGFQEELLLAVNYKPLAVHLEDGVLVFTSLEEWGRGPGLADRLGHHWERLAPYSLVRVHPGGLEERQVPATLERRALVVASGGMDSTVAATVVAEQGWQVELLHAQYGCRAEDRELEAVDAIATRMGWRWHPLHLRGLYQSIGGSTLLEAGPAVPGEQGAELAHEWVPARNLVLLSVATAWADAHWAGAIVLGNNVEEAGAYPDNEQAFLHRLQDVLPYAVRPGHQGTVVLQPLGGMTKRQIVQEGVRTGAPLDLTWSCYEGGRLHCGRCGPCYMRRRAFTMAGHRDPLRYLDQ